MIGLDDIGIKRVGAQNTIVSPNMVGRRSDRVFATLAAIRRVLTVPSEATQRGGLAWRAAQ
jgi:hypothetical protein